MNKGQLLHQVISPFKDRAIVKVRGGEAATGHTKPNWAEDVHRGEAGQRGIVATTSVGPGPCFRGTIRSYRTVEYSRCDLQKETALQRLWGGEILICKQHIPTKTDGFGNPISTFSTSFGLGMRRHYS